MSGNQKKGPFGMVDISRKRVTARVARATCLVKMGRSSFEHFLNKGSPKGDACAAAKVAGIMGAKSTPFLIPLCHTLDLDKVHIGFSLLKQENAVKITAEVSCSARTGAEMEALTGVAVAGLTVYDMMKGLDKGIVITDIRLEHKRGGKSGTYNRKKDA